jgi:hypothetical protein
MIAFSQGGRYRRIFSENIKTRPPNNLNSFSDRGWMIFHITSDLNSYFSRGQEWGIRKDQV